VPSWSPGKPAGAAIPPATVAAALLLSSAAAAWIVLVVTRDEMPMTVGPWIGLWTVMMAAMMLPSTSPLVLLYAKRSSMADSLLLAGGYVLTWAAVGLAAYVVDMRLPEPGDAAVGGVLIAAGAYQLTPFKSACLRRCRNPVDFLLTHWHTGRIGALRLGIEHGAYCVGCCWALMAVLVVAGSMSLGWVVAIAFVVAAEKLLPGGQWLARAGGIGLLAAGIVVAL
jgi:predicted metal-binding membrane protein